VLTNAEREARCRSLDQAFMREAALRAEGDFILDAVSAAYGIPRRMLVLRDPFDPTLVPQ